MTTDLDLADLRAKAEAADAIAPTGWEIDRERMTDVPDKHHEFFAIDGSGNRMFGTENADAAFGLIEVEDDGDGFVNAWNENSRRVIEFAVAAQPSTVLSLLDRLERAEKEVARLVNNAIAAEECDRQYKRDVEEHIIKPRDAEIARLRALLARAGEALKPFYTVDGAELLDWTNDDGWSACAPKNERIFDWFGPTDFRTARAVASEIEKETGHNE